MRELSFASCLCHLPCVEGGLSSRRCCALQPLREQPARRRLAGPVQPDEEDLRRAHRSRGWSRRDRTSRRASAALPPPDRPATASAGTGATMAPATMTAAGTAVTSERWCRAGAASPVETSTVLRARGTVAVGFNAARTQRFTGARAAPGLARAPADPADTLGCVHDPVMRRGAWNPRRLGPVLSPPRQARTQAVPDPAREGGLVPLEAHPRTAPKPQVPASRPVRHRLRGDRASAGSPSGAATCSDPCDSPAVSQRNLLNSAPHVRVLTKGSFRQGAAASAVVSGLGAPSSAAVSRSAPGLRGTRSVEPHVRRTREWHLEETGTRSVSGLFPPDRVSARPAASPLNRSESTPTCCPGSRPGQDSSASGAATT